MANENNKINELGPDDDDPTVELEVPVFRLDQTQNVELEADARTHDAPDTADHRSSDDTNSRLQYDIEQLQAKWLGLDTENRARGKQVSVLNHELTGVLKKVSRKDKLIKKRDGRIKLLKSEIRQRDEQFRSLSAHFITVQKTLADAPVPPADDAQATRINDRELSSEDLLRRLSSNERYADSIRQKLQDMIATSSALQSERDHLARSLATTRHRNDDFATQLDSQELTIEELREEIVSVKDQHAEEIRLLRFELGEAQDTVVHTEDLNNQLASDLVDTSHFKDELEHMLSDAEEQAGSQISTLKKQLRKLTRTIESNEQKISTKSGAITVLLSELAKKSENIKSSAEVQNVMNDIDDQRSEQCDADVDADTASHHQSIQRPAQNRITRVLVGKIGSQVLRFPLFKDRLTIGRTDDNDIQLNADYISRRHAIIQTEGDTTRVIDWGSKNGVHVNSKRVKEHFLENGDILTIGNARFRYEERKKRDP